MVFDFFNGVSASYHYRARTPRMLLDPENMDIFSQSSMYTGQVEHRIGGIDLSMVSY